MVAFTVLRQATRANPARLVAGMRVSLTSSCFARSMVSKPTLNAMNVGVRAFSGSARRFGRSTSE
jgi:cysteine sulfinate desulfinase/cysteine desulfurase-like protein